MVGKEEGGIEKSVVTGRERGRKVVVGRLQMVFSLIWELKYL